MEPRTAEKTRQDILSAAQEVFLACGYGKARTKDIADAAGVSEALLFKYFKSKEKLCVELLEVTMQAHMDSSGDYFDAEDIPAWLMHFGQDIMFPGESPTLFGRFLGESLQMMNGHYVDLNNPVDLVRDLLSPMIAKGQALGQLVPGDPTAFARIFWNFVVGGSVSEQYFDGLNTLDALRELLRVLSISPP